MRPHGGVIFVFLTTCITQVVGLNFSASSWIWTNEFTPQYTVPEGFRPFRRDFVTPNNKAAVFADMIIAVDDSYTLWLNGRHVGTGNTWNAAQGYCVLLNPFWNIFAVSAFSANSVSASGLIATIEVGYSDGTTEMVVSDSKWKTLNGAAPPSYFEQPFFSTASWTAATVHRLGPWTTISLPPPHRTTPLGLTSSNWMWTNEVSHGSAPIGSRVFRKTIMLPDGVTAGSARILIAADDDYKLFVQGTVRHQRNRAYAQVANLAVDLCPSSQVTIAIVAANSGGGPAGLLMAVQLNSTDCVCSSAGCTHIVTDNTWKYSLHADPSDNAAMYKPNFDDSAWPNAVIEGPYGMQPWGNLSIVPLVPT